MRVTLADLFYFPPPICTEGTPLWNPRSTGRGLQRILRKKYPSRCSKKRRLKEYFAQRIDNATSTSLHLLLCFAVGLKNKLFILVPVGFVPLKLDFLRFSYAGVEQRWEPIREVRKILRCKQSSKQKSAWPYITVLTTIRPCANRALTINNTPQQYALKYIWKI